MLNNLSEQNSYYQQPAWSGKEVFRPTARPHCSQCRALY